jgi:cytochrome c553
MSVRSISIKNIAANVAVLGVATGALILAASHLNAADFPEWAYPVTPKAGEFDATVLKQMPGSEKKFTQAQIENDFGPPDWFPGDHPAMPHVVEFGVPPAAKACSKCHISNGAGHPESSDLAGLPVAYIERQVGEFKNGNRKGGRSVSMIPIAKAVSDEDLRAAAEYYSALKPVAWTKVVESDTVPQSHIGTGGMRFPNENAGSEPIGDRIIELPQDPERMEMRDSRIGFIARVPVGSLAKGETLVMSGGGKTVPCATCHGSDLRGKDLVPHIIGRSPMYVFRQLNDVKVGTRAGPGTELMQQVVAKLDQDDMLAIAAYLAAQKP